MLQNSQTNCTNTGFYDYEQYLLVMKFTLFQWNEACMAWYFDKKNFMKYINWFRLGCMLWCTLQKQIGKIPQTIPHLKGLTHWVQKMNRVIWTSHFHKSKQYKLFQKI